ncbi:hypothetical protein Tco_0551375 [Tanacetum coccineum]
MASGCSQSNKFQEAKIKKADALSKIASTSFVHLSKQVLVEELKEKSINEAEVLVIVEEEGETWMTPIHEYITGGIFQQKRIGQGQSNAESKEQKLDGRDLSPSMGTPYHDQVKQWRHSFLLTYGTEAVIPAEIGMPTLRTAEVDVVRNDEALEVNLDLLEERREQAAIREAKSKRKMEKYYNAKVCSTSFKPGDLVYRNNDVSHVEQGGKLGPKWEGPYEVTEALGKGAYKLRGRDGKQLPRTWNIRNLKKCYVYRM